MVEEKPVAAFALSLVGLILQAFGALFFTTMMLYGWGSSFWGPGMMMGPWMMVGAPWSAGFGWWSFAAVLSVVVVALGLMGILWINTGEPKRVQTGSILVLVASIIAFPTMFGFIIGSLLMLVGAILGLTWQPPTAKTEG